MKKIINLTVVLVIALGARAFSYDVKWTRLPLDIRDKNLACIAVNPDKTDELYVAAETRLYKSVDNGENWQVVFTSKGENKGINDIRIYSDSVMYLATKNGVFESRDNGVNWKEILKGQPFKRNDIKSVEVKDGRYFYIITDNILYGVDEKNYSREKLFIGGIKENGPEETSDDESIELQDEESVILLKNIASAYDSLYLSTSKGIFVSCDNGRSWRKITDKGLLTDDINFCLPSQAEKNKFYAATDKGIFMHSGDSDEWINIYSNLESVKTKYICFNSAEETFLYCISGDDIYRTVDEKDCLNPPYSGYENEPSIGEVQKMAVLYAEVNPDKIKNWRKDAKLRAILPKVTFGIDHSSSDTYEIYTGSSASYSVIGPRDNTEGWDIAFTWDLGDLIYNEHQTSIDVRSKLMVQLRDEILNEITRLYFERRRLQMELAFNKPATETQAIEKKLRLEELTASIDALTGGAFSDAVKARE